MPALWIVTHLPDSPSVPILTRAAEELGLEVRVLPPDSSTVQAAVEAGRSGQLPAVFTRLGSSAPESAADVVAALEDAGCRCVNTSASIRTAWNKTSSKQAFAAAQVPTPAFVVVHEAAQLEDLSLPSPWVLKHPVSCKGLGVHLARSREELVRVTEEILDAGHGMIIEEFIAEAAGADTRVLVVGGKAVAAIRRSSGSDDFRSNLHLGGKAVAEEIDATTAATAEAAARALRLDVAGVDILKSERGPLVLEANAAPGLAGTQKATGLDLGRIIVSHVLQGA